MDLIELGEKVSAGDIIYLCDDYEEACVRIYGNEKETHAFLKLKGRAEIELPQSNELVFTILFDGREITEEEYKKY